MSPGTEAPLPQEIMSEFSRWIKAPKSRIMWVQGTPSTSGTSPLSLAATQVCDFSLKLGIPCVSFFFKPRYNIPSGSADPVSHKKAACISMLYSLVSQLVHLLPYDFRADHDGDFGEDQFRLLDGSFQSANTALKMLDALLDHATPSLVCVVDGIQFGEGPTITAYFESFLEILRLHQGQRICKMCFTTQGGSTALSRSVNVWERVDASRMAQDRPGNPLRGGSSVSELSSSLSLDVGREMSQADLAG